MPLTSISGMPDNSSLGETSVKGLNILDLPVEILLDILETFDDAPPWSTQPKSRRDIKTLANTRL
jgi:hypothetical protein